MRWEDISIKEEILLIVNAKIKLPILLAVK